MTDPSSIAAPARRVWPALAVAVGCLALFWAAGLEHLNGLRMQLGSFLFPTGGFAQLGILLLTFGFPAAIAFTVALLRLSHRPSFERLLEDWRTADDRKSMVLAAFFAVIIPLAIRTAVLGGAVLADDEGGYRFSAQLLASLRLSVPSHPEKLFFDNAFLVNDGQMYSQYPLGWPALLAPGELLGVPWLMNPLYAAATVPALFLILRRAVGSAWARLGLVLYLTSPLMMFTAATYLSQTTSMMAVLWATWFCLRARDPDAAWWSHAGLAACLGLAFFIRPMSALSLGVPLGLAWVQSLTRPGARRLTAVGAFALPAVVLATLFLASNAALTGAPFVTGYQRYAQYVVENRGRFAPWDPGPNASALFRYVPNLQWVGLRPALASVGTALLRVNLDAFGWPFSMLFLPFALRRARLVAATLGSFFAGTLLYDAGIDTFGPNHAVEVAGPLLVLTVVGAHALADWLGARVRLESPGDAARAPAALLVALILVALPTHVAARMNTLHALAQDINGPLVPVEEAGLTDAVVFTLRPFAPTCRNPGNRHFVFFRPNSAPSLDGPVIWVNHLTLERDRALMKTYFPERKGFVLGQRSDCSHVLVPLEALAPGVVPDARAADLN